MKEAILLAAELEGSNGHRSAKLIGLLRRVARDDLRRGFVMLLGRVESKSDMGVEVTYRSVVEVRRELTSRASRWKWSPASMHEPPEVIDHEGVEMVDTEG